MSTIINGSTDALTFPDSTIQTTAFKAGAVTQSTIANGVAGTGPAFSAYLNASQSVTSGVITKVAFDSEEFDTNSNFSSGRFTPTVAGYYQLNSGIYATGTANTQGAVAVYLYKNGAAYKYGTTYINNTTAGTNFLLVVSSLVYLNGTTDYAEIYGLNTATSPVFYSAGGTPFTYFNGSLVRSA